MVLAAGRGTRLAPITDTLPKPLVGIEGRTLLDRGLDNLKVAGVRHVVVNVHHLGQQVIDHLAGRTDLAVTVSDERDRLLDSGGAVVKALPLLGEAPFAILNADTFWIDPDGAALRALATLFDKTQADLALLLADPARATGHSGSGDFLVGDGCRLVRARGIADAPIYAGAAIARPSLFAGDTAEPHSLNRQFDRALAAGRLVGHVMAAPWITVGTPDALAPAAEAVRRFTVAR